jgi:hypothetical protein
MNNPLAYQSAKHDLGFDLDTYKIVPGLSNFTG